MSETQTTTKTTPAEAIVPGTEVAEYKEISKEVIAYNSAKGDEKKILSN